jgi:hypothetical protein
MGVFSVVASSTSEVLNALRAYLTEEVPSDFVFSPIDVEKPHKWQVIGSVFVDYTPLRVQICMETRDDEVRVSVNQLSHNDIIKFNLMFRQMVSYLQAYGLQIRSDLSLTSFQIQLLDDDFDFSDDEGPTWEEKIESVLDDTISIRTEVREEVFRAIAQWATSAPACREALAEGLVNRADKLFVLFCTHPQASVAETCPFAATMRTLSEECSVETRRKLLDSRLSTILDVASKAIFPYAIANNYKIAMRFLGKTEITNQIDIFSSKMSPTCKIFQEELGDEAKRVEVATVMKGDVGLKLEEKVQSVLHDTPAMVAGEYKFAMQAPHTVEVSNQSSGLVAV